MTTVGRILVILIVLFSLIFLGASTAVFTTHFNWKEAARKEKERADKLQRAVTDKDAALATAKKDADAAKSANDAARKQLEDRIAALETDNHRSTDETAKLRSELEVTTQTSKTALEEAAARKQEVDLLRQQKSDVEKEANDLKLRQAELNDTIRIRTRERDLAQTNNKDLRDRVARYSAFVRAKGFTDDVGKMKALESPPVVEGEVARVDQKNRRVEITIGSDDGLVPGHELFLYRTKPRAEYLGKVKITHTDPDQSVGQVIGTTVQGKKIQEGDVVSSTIRPRS